MKAKSTKTLLMLLVVLYSTLVGFSQAPQGLNYQAVVRDGTGKPIANQTVGLRITLLNASQVSLYTETHTPKSNELGVISVVIGEGTKVGTNTFNAIPWKNGDLSIKVEIDPSGGTTYTAMGNPTKLQSVPYALYADNTKEVVSQPSATDDEPIFVVKNKAGQIVFAVYQTGVRVYVEDSGSKGAKGGFAVGGLSNQSKESVEYLRITSDSARIFVNEISGVKGAKGGFAVGGLSNQSKSTTRNLMFVAPDSTRFYIDESTAKAEKGGFAVGGLSNQSKGNPYNLLKVTTDSTRIYVGNGSSKGAKGGFAVGGLSNQSKGISQNLMFVASDSTRFYIDDSTTPKGAKGGFAVGGLSNQSKGGNANFFNIETANKYIIKPSQARILWYPLKNAFLAGQVLIEHPDSVGINSFSSGYESKAKGQYSQALGYMARARGQNSTAIGVNAISNGANSFALGKSAQAIGADSYAFGKNAKATQSNSFAFGDNSSSISNDAYAFGSGAIASGPGSYAFGSRGRVYGSDTDFTSNYTLASGPNSFAFGLGATATGIGSVAIGTNSLASGWGSTALGVQDTASSVAGTAIGYSCTAKENHSNVALGEWSTATGYASLSAGFWAVSTGQASMSLGLATVAEGSASFATGYYTHAYAGYCTAIGKSNIGLPNSLFEVGNGTWDNWHPTNPKSNAFTILDNGYTGINCTPSYALDVNGQITSRISDAIRLRNDDYSTLMHCDLTDYYLLVTNYRDPDGSWNSFRPFRVQYSTGNVFMGSNNNGSNFSLTVQSDGKVGVNCTPSGYNLQVNGSIYSSVANGNSLVCLSSNNSYTTSMAIGRTAVEGRLAICAANSQWFGNTVPGDLVLRTELTSQKIHLGVNGSGEPGLTIALNYVGIGRYNPSYPLHVGTDNTNGNGAYLSIGGTWTGGSSRSFKDRFTNLNIADVLGKIAGMDIKGWFYKQTNEYHIGPVAEDFFNAFRTGDRNSENVNKYLSSSDVAGVTMVAVKELIKQNDEQKRELEKQHAEIETLKGELDAIKAMLKK